MVLFLSFQEGVIYPYFYSSLVISMGPFCVVIVPWSGSLHRIVGEFTDEILHMKRF